MVGDLMETIFDAVVDFGSMIFGIFDKVGAIGYIVTFSIVGLFISFIILNRSGSIRNLRSGSSDRVQDNRLREMSIINRNNVSGGKW